MSMIALLTAVRNTIRAAAPTGLAYANKDCDIAPPNGQPPPMMGPFFVSVHEGNIQGLVSYSDFDEVYSVDVTVTIKLRGTPWDRMVQNELYGATTSLDSRCRAIANLIHADNIDRNISAAANALCAPPASGYAIQGFYEPLRYAGMDRAREVGPTWFHADLDNIDANSPPYGWAKTIHFTGARRTQELGFAN